MARETKPAPQKAFSEARVLAILYDAKYKIVAVTLLAGVAAAVYASFQPEQYAATAAMIIKPVPAPLAGETPPLSVEALQSLVESADVKRELFDRLKGKGLLPNSLLFRDFQSVVTATAPREKTMQTEALPQIQLTARTKTPELCEVIANEWTQVALDRTRKLYADGVNDLHDFFAGVHDGADQSLKEAEKRRADAREASDIEISQARLAAEQRVYNLSYAKLLELEADLREKKLHLTIVTKQLSEQQIGGVWIGHTWLEAARTEQPRPVMDAFAAKQIIKTADSLIRNQEALAAFEEESGLRYKLSELENNDKELERIALAAVVVKAKSARTREELARLEKDLKEIPLVGTSKNEVTRDAVLEAATTVQKGKTPGFPFVLESEFANPVHEEIHSLVLRLRGTSAGLRAEDAEYGTMSGHLKDKMSSLSKETSLSTARKSALTAAVKLDSAHLDSGAQAYNKLRTQFESLTADITTLEETTKAGRTESGRMAESIAVTRAKITQDENKIAGIAREIASWTEVLILRAPHAEEAALLKKSLLDGRARSGIAVLYDAQASPNNVGPQKKHTVALAMLSVLLVTSCVIVVGRIVREA